jgi:formate dehydrogenase major subunit
VNKDADGKLKSFTCIKMELGEPDASGRRRPVPVEGSDFTIEIDYALAAIGQKTDVNFIGDINAFADDGSLLINKWGDIDASKDTLQTGIPSVFAAGDGVTGPATIIEAIAQAKIASASAHQYLMNLPIEPAKKLFTSRRDSFKKQVSGDYADRFVKQPREEMPTLPPDQRFNFDEVELGYDSETIANQETRRCLECGCVAFLDCDLQKYSTAYNANQKGFTGEFKEYNVDFRHPYIEIDNNKCILCGRCIRICREVVGANALGFINRGFDTFVAPSMGDALQDTFCESCGMCLSTCPTGALTENVLFKPGPVKTEEAETLCNYCSVGCSITLNHRNGFVMKVTGKKGPVNHDGNLCKYPKFGYRYLNDPSRITQPMLKVNGTFRAISFKEAFILVKEKISSVKPDENAFFAGARLSNEEMYLTQKLARAAAKTNNISSFHYLGRGDAYRSNCELNVPMENIGEASKIFLLGTEINKDHAVAGFLVQNARHLKKIPVSLITVKEENAMEHKVDEVVKIASYYHFIKAVNHYLLTNGMENSLFLNDRTSGYEDYKSALLKENYDALVKLSGIPGKEIIAQFAEDYNRQINAILIFSEKEISSATSTEVFILSMITGKLGKTANGIIALKEKNNSQGLFDMGITPDAGPGGQSIMDKAFIALLEEKWQTKNLPGDITDVLGLISGKAIRNLFIFGEDPAGCATGKDPEEWIRNADFVMVQDYFMTSTAALANLVLPASFPAETGGSYTNAQKVIQEFDAVMKPKIEMTNLGQFSGMLNQFGFSTPPSSKDVFMEFISLLPENRDHSKLSFHATGVDDFNRIFDFGCDFLVKRFDEEFENSF